MVPPQGLGFVLQTTSDQIDSALAEKCILGASVLFFAVAEKEWPGKGLSQILQNVKEFPPAYRPVVRRVSR